MRLITGSRQINNSLRLRTYIPICKPNQGCVVLVSSRYDSHRKCKQADKYLFWGANCININF